MKLLTVLVLGLIVALGLAAWKQDALRARWSQHRFPRVVLVSIDTLNLLYTDIHQPGVGLTPELATLGTEGVVFERAYTPVSITLPAHASALTGREPALLGVMVNGDRMSDDVRTLPEVLHGAGYSTGAVVSLGVLKESFGIGQGFASYDDAIEETGGRWYRYADEVVDRAIDWVDARAADPFFLWVHLSDPHEPYRARDAPADAELALNGEKIRELTLGTKERYSVAVELVPGRNTLTWTSLRPPRPDDRPATALVLELLDRDQWAAPLLAALADESVPEHFLFDPFELVIDNPSDEVLTISVPFRGRINDPPTAEVLEAYRTEVAYTDAQFARLREAFRERGLDEDTLWVVVSDHGEGLGHHGILGHATYAQEDHMRSLFLLAGPGVPGGVRVENAIVSMSDVAPTVLDLLGLRGLEEIEGESRVDCWRSGSCDGREEYWVYGASVDSNQITAVAGYRGQYKLLWQKNRRFAIYDLDADPTEEVNLSEPFLRDPSLRPRDVSKLGQTFEPQQKLFQSLLETRGQDLDAEHLEMLESLGYINN